MWLFYGTLLARLGTHGEALRQVLRVLVLM